MPADAVILKQVAAPHLHSPQVAARHGRIGVVNVLLPECHPKQSQVIRDNAVCDSAAVYQ